MEIREMTEESILEWLLHTQKYNGNQLKKKKSGNLFPIPLNLDSQAKYQRSLLPMSQKPFINIQQILFIADFPADSCEKRHYEN